MSITFAQKKQSGFTLIEVLVAALVLGTGILGLTTLLLFGLKSDQSAFYRSMASTLIYDIADRMRQNRAGVSAGSYDKIDSAGNVPADPKCAKLANGCTPVQLAKVDIREWANNFTNVDNQSNYLSPLPNATGTVIRDGNLFTITISWSEVDWDANNPGTRADSTQNLSLTLSL